MKFVIKICGMDELLSCDIIDKILLMLMFVFKVFVYEDWIVGLFVIGLL